VCNSTCIKTVVYGINSIADTNPELIKYFKYEKDYKENSKGSDKKVKLTCPECGRDFDNTMPINKLTSRGVPRCVCSSGKSINERFFIGFLEQIGVEFKTEKIFKWNKNSRYDFFIPKLNCIVEVHGDIHYVTNRFEAHSKDGRDLEYIKNKDIFKREIAISNGIFNYIEINCEKSSIEHISNSIVNSKLSELFDLSKINWSKCMKLASKPIVKLICEYKNNNPSFGHRKIGENFNMDKTTVRKYLNIGADCGWLTTSINAC